MFRFLNREFVTKIKFKHIVLRNTFLIFAIAVLFYLLLTVGNEGVVNFLTLTAEHNPNYVFALFIPFFIVICICINAFAYMVYDETEKAEKEVKVKSKKTKKEK